MTHRRSRPHLALGPFARTSIRTFLLRGFGNNRVGSSRTAVVTVGEMQIGESARTQDHHGTRQAPPRSGALRRWNHSWRPGIAGSFHRLTGWLTAWFSSILRARFASLNGHGFFNWTKFRLPLASIIAF